MRILSLDLGKFKTVACEYEARRKARASTWGQGGIVTYRRLRRDRSNNQSKHSCSYRRTLESQKFRGKLYGTSSSRWLKRIQTNSCHISRRWTFHSISQLTPGLSGREISSNSIQSSGCKASWFRSGWMSC